MSRKIKFRAWDGYEFIELDYAKGDIWRCGSFKCLNQYTGLKDKNGVEIYEGDILKNERFDFVGVVGDIRETFRTNSAAHDSFCYAAGNEYEVYYEGAENDKSDSVVIGNIYQHSELLEQIGE